MKRITATKGALLTVVASTIGCDQVSKHFATVHLMGAPRQSYCGDSFRLEYAENRGAFLSIGADWPHAARTAIFTAGTAVILIACVVAIVRSRRAHRTVAALLGLSLIIAGGVSNLADRILNGAVVDFLNVGVGPVRTGIFNVADMAIMAGIVLLLLRREASKPGGAEGEGEQEGAGRA